MELLIGWAFPALTDLDWFGINVLTIGATMVALTIYSFWIKE